MAESKPVFFQGKVLRVGDSNMIVIPASNCHYLGIMAGDYVEAKITKIQSYKARGK